MTDAFWSLIRESSGNPDSLKAILQYRSDEEVLEFARSFHQCLVHLNRWEVWGAGYVINGEMSDGTVPIWLLGFPMMSDNSFRFFRCWIVGKGREAYETALSTPDNLGDFVGEDETVDNELLEDVAIEILEGRGLEDPRDNMDCADDDLQGEEWDEDTVGRLYPKLTARFG